MQRIFFLLHGSRISFEKFYCFGLTKYYTFRVSATETAVDDFILYTIEKYAVKRAGDNAFLTLGTQFIIDFYRP